MDLVRQLRDVRFDMAMRGYDCVAVDTFLAKLRADVASAQENHAAAQARVAELEASLGTQDNSDTEGTLRRTLLLAQRLADETEAEAKAVAAETVNAAGVEADQVRHDAEIEAAGMKRAAEEELTAAREEASGIRDTMNEQAARDRAATRITVDEMLLDAERTSRERVREIEQVAQHEVATLREPIREEVEQLEVVRARLLQDIAELEAHLEAQRDRVKNAVEALRIGMSGSIEDLQRVAEDDALLATEPAPETSGSSGADVPKAADVEIVDRVAATAPPAPTSSEVEQRSLAVSEAQMDDTPEPQLEDTPEPQLDDTPVLELDDTAAPASELESAPEPSSPAHAAEPDTVVDPVEEVPVVATSVDADVSDPGPATEPIPVITADAADAEVVEDAELAIEAPAEGDDESSVSGGTFAALGGAVAGAVGGAAVGSAATAGDHVDDHVAEIAAPDVVEAAAEPVTIATAADLEEAELVVLEQEESALFGTEIGADAEAETLSEDVPGDVDDETPVPAASADSDTGGVSFVTRFAEILDELPVSPTT